MTSYSNQTYSPRVKNKASFRAFITTTFAKHACVGSLYYFYTCSVIMMQDESTHMTISKSLFDFDTRRKKSKPVNPSKLIKKLLSERLKQIDELKDLCQSNIDKDTDETRSCICELYDFMEKQRENEMSYLQKNKSDTSIKSLHMYIETLAKLRKDEAKIILKLRDTITEDVKPD